MMQINDTEILDNEMERAIITQYRMSKKVGENQSCYREIWKMLKHIQIKLLCIKNMSAVKNILSRKVADQGKYQCAWSPSNRNYAKETHKNI